MTHPSAPPSARPLPAPPSARPLPAQVSLVLFWARFHAVRTLRRPASTLWVLASVLIVVSLRLFGSSSARDLVDFEVTLIMPLLAMLFGSGGLREEVEDQTLTYAFVRPFDRGGVFVARTLAACAVVCAPVLLGVAIAANDPVDVARDLAVAVLGAAAYTSVFAVLGLVLRHPTLIGLGVLAWEQVVGGVPGFLSRLTLRAHLRGLLELDSGAGLFSSMFRAPAWWVSLPILIGVTALALAGGVWWVRHRELVVPK